MSHKITFATLGWPPPSSRGRNRAVTVIGAACGLLFNGSTPMTKPISPLRQRMLDDMAFRNMSPATQRCYTYAVACFARFHRTSPDKLGIEHVREYRLHLLSRGLKARSINPIVGALRFFYGTTLGNKALADQIGYARPEDTLPAVLTQDQVLGLIKAEPDLMMRTIFITIYAAGLRISEVIRLSTGDINGERMVIHVRQAKGHKDRYVMLSDKHLAILRSYWKRRQPEGDLLFPGPLLNRPITARSVQRAFRQAADDAGLDQAVSPHTLRHSFATHLLEQGVDVRVIQDLLGHRNINSTARYARVAINTIRKIQSPLEPLVMEMAELD
jgi:integrase/recombinase XerD